MKVSTAQFMRECVAQTSIYIGTFRTALDENDLAQKINWDVLSTAQRRKAVKKSYGLDFIREDGEHSRLDSSHTSVEKYHINGYDFYRVACLNPTTLEPCTQSNARATFRVVSATIWTHLMQLWKSIAFLAYWTL